MPFRAPTGRNKDTLDASRKLEVRKASLPHASDRADAASEEIFVGRQAIYDRTLNLIGHELLFRDAERDVAAFECPVQATSQVLLHALLDIGLDRIAGTASVFVNIPQGLISDSITEILPPHRTVLEILEGVDFNDEVAARLTSLRGSGYRLALDDFVYSEERARELELVDIVKVDVRVFDTAALAEQVRLLRRYPLQLIAEKIETEAEFQLCNELGFEGFQGYFLSRPEIIHGTRSTVDLSTLTLLIESCRDPLTGNLAIARQVEQNATLSYRLLQAAKSCFDERQAPINSVDEAVDFLGTAFVSRLASLFLRAGATNLPSYRLLVALQRARMCELLAGAAQIETGGQSYLVGLLSALDLLLDQRIEAIISPLPLAEELKGAIVRHEGPLGSLLEVVIAYEQGDWDTISAAGFDVQTVSDAYWRAVPRVDEFRKALNLTAVRSPAVDLA
jgi:EAL and modified HD-GYP domain-containing signal transduction protein